MGWPTTGSSCERVVNIPMAAFRPDPTDPTNEFDSTSLGGVNLHQQSFRHNSGNNERALAAFYMEDWDTTVVPIVHLVWFNATNAGNVVWRVSLGLADAGDVLGIWNPAVNIVVPNDVGANTINLNTMTPELTGTLNSGRLAAILQVRRMASHVLDTLDSDARMIGAAVTYQVI